MDTYGFGPLHPTAVTERPNSDVDGFNEQTWFRDETAPGLNDGTVLSASWLNMIVANLVTLADDASVNPMNQQGLDTVLLSSVSAIAMRAVQSIGTPLYRIEHDQTLSGIGTGASPLRVIPGAVPIVTDGSLSGRGTSASPLSAQGIINAIAALDQKANALGLVYPDRISMLSTAVPVVVMGFTVLGYAVAGDGGFGEYRRIVAPETLGPEHIELVDGSVFEYVPDGSTVHVGAFGAVATATSTERVTAWNNAILFAAGLVGDQSDTEGDGFFINVNGGGRNHIINSTILLDTTNHRGIRVHNAKLTADATGGTWSVPMMLIDIGAVVGVENIYFECNRVADGLLKKGWGAKCEIRQNTFRHFKGATAARPFAIRNEEGAATVIDGNDAMQWISTDTEFSDPAERTGVGLWQCSSDNKIGVNRFAQCGIPLMLGDVANGLEASTNVFSRNNTYNDGGSSPMRGLTQIRIEAGSQGNTFGTHYVGNGHVDLYDHRQSFHVGQLMGTTACASEARFRLFANEVGQVAFDGFYLEMMPNASVSRSGFSVDVTTADTSDIVVMSAADVASVAVRNKLTGTGIPSGARVIDIVSSTEVQISAAATATGTSSGKCYVPTIELYDDGANTWAIASSDTLSRHPQCGVIISRGGVTTLGHGTVSEPVWKFGRLGTGIAEIAFENASTVTSPRIGADGDQMVFCMGSTEYWRVDASGRMLRGLTAALSSDWAGGTATPTVQTGGAGTESSHLIGRFVANSGGPGLVFLKSRGSVGTFSDLNLGDNLGTVTFGGAAGGVGREGAKLLAQADGASSSGVLKGRMSCWVANASSVMTEAWRVPSTLELRPGADNTQTLGTSSFRWSVVYAGTGTINTSDVRLKRVRGLLTTAELAAWSAVQATVFQMLDAVAEKGDAARLHVGYIAQEIEAAFAAQGLDVRRYALFCEDPLLETYQIQQSEAVPRLVPKQITRTVPTIMGDHVVMTEVVETMMVPAQRYLPVLDASGAPVLDEDERPQMHVVEEVDMITTTSTEERPVLDETGAPVTRLSLRYEQCLVLEAAYQRTLAADLARRVAALEQR